MSGAALVALALVAAVLVVAARERRRAELTARAVHELRSPLTAARLALHGLGPGPVAAVVDLELRRAALAVDDLAVARRGRRAADRLEVLDVAGLLDEVRASWAPVAEGLGIELRVVGPGPGLLVRGDRLRLAQGLGNLLGNALEHGAGPVVVAARRQGAAVRLEVGDRGRGLPAAVPALVARPRGGRGERGRGLAIAAGVAARHGGRLAALPSAAGARLALDLPALDLPERGVS